MFRKSRSFGRGGVHPPEMKITSGMEIKDIGLPRKAVVLLSQSIGKPALPTVGKGEHVEIWQKIGEAQGFVSANVHTPISGTVKEIGTVYGSDGHPSEAITIEADEADHLADIRAIADAMPRQTLASALDIKPTDLISAIGEAGIVGLGGATFPTRVKLSPSPSGKADLLLINGAECEPYLTCDEALMRQMADEIMQGVAILMRAVEVDRAIVGIEDNKPEAIRRMAEASRRYNGIEVVRMKTRYPQGGEKMLTKTLTGREIAPGKLPITSGVIIQNVATALAVYHAVIWGMPLTDRVVTISGKDMASRGNYRIAIGTPIKEIIDSLGGIPESTVRIISGGTMMGRSLADIEGYMTKGTGGLLLLSEEESPIDEESPCVRCGRCVEVCPMGLEPYLIAKLGGLGRYESARDNHIMDCMECGSCSYACISRRRLVDRIRIGKMGVRNL